MQLQCEAIGSTSSEQGSVSPDCDSKHDVFFQKKKSSGSENLLKPPNSNYLRSARSCATVQECIPCSVAFCTPHKHNQSLKSTIRVNRKKSSIAISLLSCCEILPNLLQTIPLKSRKEDCVQFCLAGGVIVLTLLCLLLHLYNELG